jgi:hypothetical protein
MLIVRTHEGRGGEVRIEARADGLKPANVTVNCQPSN